MAIVQIAHAGSNEWGTTHGGEAGNQRRTAGKLDGELKVTDWYDKPWTYCIRPKDPAKAKIIADTALACVKNVKIGYDQNERQTLYRQMKANNWDATKVDYCETDCSSLWGVCANAAGIYIDPVVYTGTMKQFAEQSGAFEILTDEKYLKTDKYLKRGDGLVKPFAHAVIVISDGDSAGQEVPDPAPAPSVGYTHVYIATGDVWLRKGPGTNYATIKVVNRGDQVYVKNNVNGWLEVQYGYSTGYSSAKYYKYVEDVEEKTQTPLTLITTAKLWLRQSAGISGKALTVIPQGTRLNCSGNTTMVGSTKWYEVAYNTYVGWSSGKYLKEAPSSMKFKTTATLNMRKGASTTTDIIQVVSPNQVVTSTGEYITNQGVRWYYCTYNGKSGYMSNMYLKEV